MPKMRRIEANEHLMADSTDIFPDPFAMNRRALLGWGAVLLTFGPMTVADALAATDSAVAFSSSRLGVTTSGSRAAGGHDVLLIPGLASGPAIWSGLQARLSGHRLHLVHIAGFAGKPAGLNRSGALLGPLTQELVRYVSERKLQKPAIIGHSMGGTLAMMTGLQAKGRIDRVMVVDMLPAGAGMLGGTSQGLGYIAEQLNGYFTGTKAGRQLLANMISQTPGARDSDPNVIAQALTELARTDLTAQLSSLGCPLTVVHALSADRDVAVAQKQRFRAAYSNATRPNIEGIGPSGHMVMIDQAEKFASAVRGFLA